MEKHLKKVFGLWLLLTLSTTPLSAQQKPQYSQYILNQFILNHALTGIENYSEIMISHRRQWTGIEGAPETYYLTAHTPLGKKDYRTTATSQAVEGIEAITTFRSPVKPHHGAGFQVVNDKSGPLSTLSAYATYAYHIGLTRKLTLSAGFGAGFNRYSLNASLLEFNNITVDPVVYSGNYLNKAGFDMMTGLYLYSQNFFLGISAQQILPSGLSFSENSISRSSGTTVPHLFATTGYRFGLGNDINLITSLMVKYVSPLPLQPEVSAKIQFRNLFWLGAGYRHSDGFYGLLGLNISPSLSIGYAYDNKTSSLVTSGVRTHEFVLGYIIGNRFTSGCPSLRW